MPVSSVTEHWIKQDAITINLNHFGDPDYLQVSVLAGAVVMAFKQDVIGYNAAHNYRTWPLQAANTYLESTSAVNVYARLTRSEVNASALIIYDPVLRDIEGREISYEEVEGEKKEVLGDPNPDYFFIYLGEISASLSESGMSVLRDWSVSFRFGSLDTNQFQNEEAGGEWTKMFRLNKVTDLIDVLKTFSNAVFKKLSIKRNDKEKPIVDLKRSIDSDEEVPVSDEIIPTTKYLHSVTDERFLRKDKDDRSVGTISSDKGFEVGDYVPGELGIGGIFKIDENGDSYIEVDKALFRKIAYFVEIMIKKLSHVGGSIILSPASMKCSKVEDNETYYRCYFENEHEGKTINQEFVVGDQARSQTFNIKEGLSQNVSNQYYWRLVVGVGSNYIDLSKADCDSGSGIPLAGDDIVQLGNRDNPSRQRAIILSSYGEGTPSIIMYRGIKSYSMSDAKMPLRLSPDGNIIEGDFISKSGKNLEEWMSEVEVNWDKVLEQTDKEFTMWFFEYDPSPEVYPESEWFTDELRALHEQDLFYNTAKGMAWRYTLKDGVFFWELVTDADTLKALEDAARAQQTADGAVQRLDNIVSDGKLSAVEKKEVRKEWASIMDAYEWNMYSSERIGIDMQSQEVVRYSNAYNALSTYITPLLDEDGDSDINPDEYRGYWTDYYTTETKLRNFLSEKAKEKADDVNDRVDDIVSDGVLSSLEKKEVLKEWQSVVAQYAFNKNYADKYELDYSDYTNAYHALGTYLNNGVAWNGSGTPLWIGTQIGVNTTLSSPTEYRKVWVDYYKAESILRERISEAGLGTRVQNFKTYPNELPVPPYNVGDRWMNAYYTVGGVTYAENDDMVCVQAKAKNEVASIRDWEFSSGMNSDTKKDIEASIKNLGDSIDLEVSEREGAISELQITIDGIRTLVGDAQDAADSAYTRANSAYNRANDAYSYADSVYQIADALGTKVDNNATAISQNSNYISLWAGNFNEQGEVITESGLVIGSTFTNLYSRLGDNVSYRASIASDLSGNFYFGTSGIVGSTGSLKYFTGGKKYKLYIEPNNATSLYLYYYDGSTGTNMASLIGLTEYTINSFNASKGNYMYVVMYGSTTSIDIRIVEVTGSSNNLVETDIITYTIPSKYHYVGYNSFDSFSKPLRKFNRGNKVNIAIGSNDAYTLKLYYWDGSIRTQIASLNGVSEYVIESFNDSYGDYLVFEIAGNTSSFSININDAIDAGLSTSVQYDPSTGRITSNVKISADNVDINGIVKVSGTNTIKIGGWTVEENRLYAETGFSSVGTIDDYSISIEPSGMKVSYGDDFITAEFGANYASISDWGGISALNIVNHKSVGAVGYTKMCALRVKGDPNDMGIIVEGAGCAFRPSSGAVTSIHGLAVNARSNSGSIRSNDDFIKVDRKTELPSPKELLGKILFVKCSSMYTLTVPNCVLDNESSSDGSEDFQDNHMRAFISNSTYWFEMNLTNTW